MKHIKIIVTDDSGKVLDTFQTKRLPERNLNAEDISERAAEMVYDAWEQLNEESTK